MPVRIKSIRAISPAETYDIENRAPDASEGNFLIRGLVVHNSILGHGVKSFDDLMLLSAMGHPGPMQCVRTDSLVNSENGYVQIKDLNGEKILALSNVGEPVFTDKYKVFESGKKRIMKIRTESGKEIFVSPDHKILTENGYVRAAELRQGFKIRTIDRKSPPEA